MSRVIIIKGSLLWYLQGSSAASLFHLLPCKKELGGGGVETCMKYVCTKDLMNLIIQTIMLPFPSERAFTLGFHHTRFKQAS